MSSSVRWLTLAVLVLALVGCSCEDRATLRAPQASTAEPEPEVPAERLPAASRTDLPALTPAITIRVHEGSFVVSNRAVVETWPETERAAVERTRPVGDADYPIVERDVDDASDALAIPGLSAALREVAAVESARAAIVHAEGSPTAFALRADADVPFGRVLSAVYAAAMVGLNQPRLVLASAEGERELRLTQPNTQGEADDPAIAAALARALAIAHGETPPPEVDAGLPPRPARISVALATDGLTFRRGDVPYAPGCAEPAPGASEPTIPTATVRASTIDACVSAIGDEVVGAIVFRAQRDTRYADVVAVLEALAARHEVNLAVSID